MLKTLKVVGTTKTKYDNFALKVEVLSEDSDEFLATNDVYHSFSKKDIAVGTEIEIDISKYRYYKHTFVGKEGENITVNRLVKYSNPDNKPALTDKALKDAKKAKKAKKKAKKAAKAAKEADKVETVVKKAP